MVAHACSSSYLGGWGGSITWAQVVEAAVSYDYATTLPSGQESKTLSQTNKQMKKERLDQLWWLIPVISVFLILSSSQLPISVDSTFGISVRYVYSFSFLLSLP